MGKTNNYFRVLKYNTNFCLQVSLKRVFDVIFSIILIIVLSPLFVFVTLLIYFQCGFPILYIS